MTKNSKRPAAGPAAAHVSAGSAASHSAAARRTNSSSARLTEEAVRNLCSEMIHYGLMDLANPELRPFELSYFRGPWFDTMADYIAPELKEKIRARLDAAFPGEQGCCPTGRCPVPACSGCILARDFLSQPEEVTVIVRKARASC